MPRLAPIDSPPSLFMRLAYWASRRQFGAVITPMRVSYARNPRFALAGSVVGYVLDRGLSLDADVVHLVSARVAQVNGCAFCEDLSLAMVVQKRLGMDRFRALADYRTSPLFSERERAAIAFGEEASLERRVSDATFRAARAHFDETEVAELAWVAAAQTFYNVQNGALAIESDGLAALAEADRQEPAS